MLLLTRYAILDYVMQVICKFFQAARRVGTIVVLITKDRDFSELVLHHGVPPQILWVTCGKTSNARLRIIFERLFP